MEIDPKLTFYKITYVKYLFTRSRFCRAIRPSFLSAVDVLPNKEIISAVSYNIKIHLFKGLDIRQEKFIGVLGQ